MRIKFLATAEHDLARIDKTVARLILKRLVWFAENYESLNPISLKGEFKEFKKFRIGDYRALYTVNTDEKTLIVHFVRHRREVYKGK